MIHYWLTDTDGSQYINNPGCPDHASKSNDGGVTWDRPRNVNTVVQREERMAEIMEMAERNREAERQRLADQRDANLYRNVANDPEFQERMARDARQASPETMAKASAAQAQLLLEGLQDNRNHIGNMQTPGEAALERHKARVAGLLALKAEVDKKTIGERMADVLGCAMFAVCLVGCATVTVIGIDAIIKIVGAW
jgi:hypothetical protein